MERIRVFTYGTLRQGQRNHGLLVGSQFLGPAVTAAGFSLYSFGHFPGATRGQGRLRGEVYAVDPACLARLDQLEGYPTIYDRTPIDTPYGQAWIYLYRQSLQGARLLPGGDWVTRDTDAALIYFAYGSNLSLARLQARVPSATALNTGWVAGHQLRFHKRGVDGSGKCDLYETGEQSHQVHGVLYSMQRTQKLDLDAIEGLGHGYLEKQISVQTGQGFISASTYVANLVADNLVPFDWYLAFVLAGAREHGLPETYIQALASVRVARDRDAHRRRKNLGILNKPPGRD